MGEHWCISECSQGEVNHCRLFHQKQNERKSASSSRPEQAPGRNEKEKEKKKVRACQTSFDTHPIRAPRGQDRGRGRDHQTPSIQPRQKTRPSRLRGMRGQPEFLHSRVSRISIINQGGICGSFKEPREGRIL
ncbi:hypothetical protein CGRA01v4_01795 [Colletotrichum graminicola]|nr:hypothetical protein CGRA01v4_01795 [Colletotrichum graminicola]